MLILNLLSPARPCHSTTCLLILLWQTLHHHRTEFVVINLAILSWGRGVCTSQSMIQDIVREWFMLRNVRPARGVTSVTYLVCVNLLQDGVDVLRQEPLFLLESSTELIHSNEPGVDTR